MYNGVGILQVDKHLFLFSIQKGTTFDSLQDVRWP